VNKQAFDGGKTMELTTRTEKSAVVVTIKGRVDATTAPELEKGISDQIDSGVNTLILNMTELDYISSAGLRVVLLTAKKLKSQQGDLLLAGLQGPVYEVFEISGFTAIFNMFDTEEAALAQV
jgi:anti-anti-sigma factor